MNHENMDDSIAVYGYDPRMLVASMPKDQDIFNQTPTPDKSRAAESPGQITGESRLLNLPVELRTAIFEGVLPSTFDAGRKGIVWRRGNLAILSTNRQLYKEAISILYSHNVFVIDVIFDCCTFFYQYRNSFIPTRKPFYLSALVSKRALAFPEYLAPRNIALIRRLCIRVHHVDSYVGMVKYNYSGHGLTDGLQTQVKFLCQALRTIPEIISLHVDFQDDSKTEGTDEIVLQPFLCLTNTRHVALSGDCSSSFERAFRDHLFDAYDKKGILSP
jgi:hypothetical protein